MQEKETAPRNCSAEEVSRMHEMETAPRNCSTEKLLHMHETETVPQTDQLRNSDARMNGDGTLKLLH